MSLVGPTTDADAAKQFDALPRRKLLSLVTGAAVLPALPRIASALDYPTRPVHIIIGYPPGGPADIVARLIGQWLSERLGQPFVVENRPGAATNIATEAVVRSLPDGYTLLVAVSTNTVNPSLYPDLGFNFVRDMAMVAGVTRFPLVLEANPTVPVHSVPELIADAKAHPGKISWASFGTGTISHIAGVLFQMRAGIEMVHVPYRGSAPLVVDLLAGQVQTAMDNLQSSIEYIRGKKFRALAVTSGTRSPWLPDVPALGDFLPGYEVNAWIGIATPKKTPVDVVNKLNKEINLALADPKITAWIADSASTAFVASPPELDKMVAEQTEKWAKVIRAAGIRAE
jgi:tripartite-type tricarboxylate transporter receptor subunit TctC